MAATATPPPRINPCLLDRIGKNLRIFGRASTADFAKLGVFKLRRRVNVRTTVYYEKQECDRRVEAHDGELGASLRYFQVYSFAVFRPRFASEYGLWGLFA